MSFKLFLQTDLETEKLTESIQHINAKEFKDSGEATDFIYTISQMLKTPALKNWSKITDKNFKSESLMELTRTIEAYNKFVHEIENAE